MGTENNAPDLLKRFLLEPESVVERINLVYVDSSKLAITRAGTKNQFEYFLHSRPIREGKILNRIQSLAVPPAWEQVNISHLPNGHLQAVGRDAKNRKQYRYHPLWNKVRNQTKFYKMSVFGEVLPDIRKRVDSDLDLQGWPRDKVVALIIRLMEETHIRIGNEQYAKRNNTYGLSTMRTRHINAFKDKLRFEFTGKKGKKHRVTLRNKRLIRLVNRCEEIPGWELFQFFDSEGKKQSVDSGMVNDYIHKISGEIFTAKDFRTWAATIIFFESLRETEKPRNKKEEQQNILKAFDSAARQLGNTRNVCRKYYVHPALPQAYESNILDVSFKQANAPSAQGQFFTTSEAAVLKLIKLYKPHSLKTS